jgi:hypothetical protein
MYNNIILSSYLFGSIYIFSTTLTLINLDFVVKNRKIPNELKLINASILMLTGSTFIYTMLYNRNLLKALTF